MLLDAGTATYRAQFVSWESACLEAGKALELQIEAAAAQKCNTVVDAAGWHVLILYSSFSACPIGNNANEEIEIGDKVVAMHAYVARTDPVPRWRLLVAGDHYNWGRRKYKY